MSYRFQSACHDECVEVGLVKSGLFKAAVVPKDEWPLIEDGLKPTIRRLLSLQKDGKAEWRADRLLIQNSEVAAFSGAFAAVVGLPELAAVQADISFIGTIAQKNSFVQIDWKDAAYERISPRRTGILLRWGERAARLQGALFRLVEAIDRFNEVAGSDIDTKVRCWSAVTEALTSVSPDIVNADGYTKSLTVFQAGSFALDIHDRGDNIEFDPILMSRSKARSLEDNAPTEDLDAPGEDQNPFDDLRNAPPEDMDAPGEESDPSDLRSVTTDRLLTGEDQRAFLREFNGETHAKAAYKIRRSTYLIVDPDLRRALDVVKRAKTGTENEKRSFIKNPRAAIAAAFGAEDDREISAALFIETRQYSERVTGLGLWERPELPWLSKAQTSWLPERFPVKIGDREVEVDREEVEKLQEHVATAENDGRVDVPFRDGAISLDDAHTVLDQVRTRAANSEKEAKNEAASESVTVDGRGSGPIVVQIKTNFDDLAYEVERRPRRAFIDPVAPASRMGKTSFKPHQDEGFLWLVESWTAGWPGVLLADDMGLGKTYQGLAFLAWIIENQSVGANARHGVKNGPILIVAPTALLENWIKESEKHLAFGALGFNRADVFGSGINRFRNPPGTRSPEPLDWRKLDDHDWILTTYETLADNHTAFAKISFAVAIFDEIQKIKDPGTLNTWSAKSINADFVLGLSGTPIENRIEDLWSVTDRVFPGLLKDLRSFSNTYRNADAEAYRALSDTLLKPVDGAPAIMLRRMKKDVLVGLPEKTIEKYPTDMPPIQAERYSEIVKSALSLERRGRGAMLEIVQKLRGVSLFPSDPSGFDLTKESDCNRWIEQSARLGRTFEILRTLERKGEKVLIFVEHRAMQEAVAEAVSTLFGMERPTIINGATPGHRRQKLVDEFEARKVLFDTMILSPKAAGVGLTIIAANHVIHLSRWWNPAVEDQCNDRVYRIGQERPVWIHVPIARHPDYQKGSFDHRLDLMLDTKRKMSENLLMPPIMDSDLDEMYSGVTGRAA